VRPEGAEAAGIPADDRERSDLVHTLRESAVVALGGLALSLILLPSSASATGTGTSTVVPVTTFTVTSSQCDGPTYLPVLYEGTLLADVFQEIAALEGLPPGEGETPPTLSSCSPLPEALSPLVGSASVSSVASPNGSASVAVEALGNEAVEESADVNTTLSGSITLSSPASSVDFSIPYTTSGVSQSSTGSAAIVAFSQSPGLIKCVDGSNGIWSPPPGQYDLSAPTGPGSGTWSLVFSCPDGSDLAPGVLGPAVYLLAGASSDNGQTESASANFQMYGVTATIDS
jgi:hypothetical protein